ncbi:MAG TPA: uracil-DNA glycosylase family protein [Longimicrobiales bacterium]|nr:uracil-DNA glycosylase family protein [Longimicrobiales bacterium]
MDAIETRFRDIFRTLHAEHPNCLRDEWLTTPCADAGGAPVPRSIIWSRRNGPWQQTDLLWIGAAPGNAGGKGSGQLGAHATRIPFGGDIAGGNLDVLLGSIGLDRNRTFITASYNQLPAAGGGEPTVAELAAPVGRYESSVHVVRDTIVAAGPRIIVALGNVALRVTIAAARVDAGLRLPTLAQLTKLGLTRNVYRDWPEALPPDVEFLERWQQAWSGRDLPGILWLTHPSAQNMSPYARTDTLFHTRMLDARAALRAAVRAVLGWNPPRRRAEPPSTGIYALPEWRNLIGPRHFELDRMWLSKNV